MFSQKYPPFQIVRLGNNILREKSIKVEDPTSDRVKEIIARMYATIDKIGVVAGLAAPQIGVNEKIFIYQVTPHSESSVVIPYTTVINPEIEVLDNNTNLFPEGCLSFRDFRGVVPRYNKLVMNYLNDQGKKEKVLAEGYHARVIQHEVDHLNGKVYLDRIKDLKKFGYGDEVNF